MTEQTKLNIEGKDWLTVDEAAHYCGVSKSQFSARAPEYDLIPRRFMGKKLYERAALYNAIFSAPCWDGQPGPAYTSNRSPVAPYRNLSASRLRPFKPRKPIV